MIEIREQCDRCGQAYTSTNSVRSTRIHKIQVEGCDDFTLDLCLSCSAKLFDLLTPVKPIPPDAAPEPAAEAESIPSTLPSDNSELVSSLQAVIDEAGAETVFEAVTAILECDVQSGTIAQAIGLPYQAVNAVIRHGAASGDFAAKFKSVFKLKEA